MVRSGSLAQKKSCNDCKLIECLHDWEGKRNWAAGLLSVVKSKEGRSGETAQLKDGKARAAKDSSRVKNTARIDSGKQPGSRRGGPNYDKRQLPAMGCGRENNWNFHLQQAERCPDLSPGKD